LSYRV